MKSHSERYDRRSLLRGIGTSLVVAGLAGCASPGGSEEGEEGGSGDEAEGGGGGEEDEGEEEEGERVRPPTGPQP